MVDIWYFLKYGDLGNIRLGMNYDEIIQILEQTDDIFQDDKKEIVILKYGVCQLTFEQRILMNIQISFLDDIANCSDLLLVDLMNLSCTTSILNNISLNNGNCRVSLVNGIREQIFFSD